jgi:RimJ/RimL family protein N-acetyltransferase
MTAVLEGTLDAHSRRELARLTPAEQAADQYDDEFARYETPRSWWRVAERPDGTPVGFVIPARNAYNPIIAYIGVVPAFRGNGYVDDILGEGTRVLAAEGVPRIRASTDVDNVPMARAFARAGYTTFERQLDMVWDSPRSA